MASTLLLVAGIVSSVTRFHLVREADDRLRSLASAFAEGPGAGSASADAFAAETRRWLEAQALPDHEGLAVRIPGLDGEETVTAGLDISRVPRSRQLVSSGERQWWKLRGDEVSIRALTVPIEIGGRTTGTFVALASPSTLEGTLGGLTARLLWASALGLLLASGAALYSIRRALRPLARVSDEIDRIHATGDVTLRIPRDGPDDEAGRLSTALNRMLERLDESFRVQRRFLADASHELGKPITVTRTQLELLERRVRDPDGRRALAVSVEELDRIERIVEELLLLARLDDGLPLVREPVRVQKALREALLRGLVLAERTTSVKVVGDLYVLADRHRLVQALTNLVSNAVHHGGERSRIQLTAYRRADRVAIEVSDDGRGIPAGDLPHVFRPLYRGATARHGATTGAGLGLAVAASLVQAMDGEIRVRSIEGEGTTFLLDLPAAAAPDHLMSPPSAPRERESSN
jgi:signal transduction histidine kinase